MKKILLFTFSLSLVGCTNLHFSSNIYKSKPKAYLKARSVPELQLPPGYTKPESDDQLSIPSYTNNESPASLLPPGSLAAKKEAKKALRISK